MKFKHLYENMIDAGTTKAESDDHMVGLFELLSWYEAKAITEGYDSVDDYLDVLTEELEDSESGLLSEAITGQAHARRVESIKKELEELSAKEKLVLKAKLLKSHEAQSANWGTEQKNINSLKLRILNKLIRMDKGEPENVVPTPSKKEPKEKDAQGTSASAANSLASTKAKDDSLDQFKGRLKKVVNDAQDSVTSAENEVQDAKRAIASLSNQQAVADKAEHAKKIENWKDLLKSREAILNNASKRLRIALSKNKEAEVGLTKDAPVKKDKDTSAKAKAKRLTGERKNAYTRLGNANKVLKSKGAGFSADDIKGAKAAKVRAQEDIDNLTRQIVDAEGEASRTNLSKDELSQKNKDVKLKNDPVGAKEDGANSVKELQKKLNAAEDKLEDLKDMHDAESNKAKIKRIESEMSKYTGRISNIQSQMKKLGAETDAIKTPEKDTKNKGPVSPNAPFVFPYEKHIIDNESKPQIIHLPKKKLTDGETAEYKNLWQQWQVIKKPSTKVEARAAFEKKAKRFLVDLSLNSDKWTPWKQEYNKDLARIRRELKAVKYSDSAGYWEAHLEHLNNLKSKLANAKANKLGSDAVSIIKQQIKNIGAEETIKAAIEISKRHLKSLTNIENEMRSAKKSVAGNPRGGNQRLATDLTKKDIEAEDDVQDDSADFESLTYGSRARSDALKVLAKYVTSLKNVEQDETSRARKTKEAPDKDVFMKKARNLLSAPGAKKGEFLSPAGVTAAVEAYKETGDKAAKRHLMTIIMKNFHNQIKSQAINVAGSFANSTVGSQDDLVNLLIGGITRDFPFLIDHYDSSKPFAPYFGSTVTRRMHSIAKQELKKTNEETDDGDAEDGADIASSIRGQTAEVDKEINRLDKKINNPKTSSAAVKKYKEERNELEQKREQIKADITEIGPKLKTRKLLKGKDIAKQRDQLKKLQRDLSTAKKTLSIKGYSEGTSNKAKAEIIKKYKEFRDLRDEALGVLASAVAEKSRLDEMPSSELSDKQKSNLSDLTGVISDAKSAVFNHNKTINTIVNGSYAKSLTKKYLGQGDEESKSMAKEYGALHALPELKRVDELQKRIAGLEGTIEGLEGEHVELGKRIARVRGGASTKLGNKAESLDVKVSDKDGGEGVSKLDLTPDEKADVNKQYEKDYEREGVQALSQILKDLDGKEPMNALLLRHRYGIGLPKLKEHELAKYDFGAHRDVVQARTDTDAKKNRELVRLGVEDIKYFLKRLHIENPDAFRETKNQIKTQYDKLLNPVRREIPKASEVEWNQPSINKAQQSEAGLKNKIRRALNVLKDRVGNLEKRSRSNMATELIKKAGSKASNAYWGTTTGDVNARRMQILKFVAKRLKDKIGKDAWNYFMERFTRGDYQLPKRSEAQDERKIFDKAYNDKYKSTMKLTKDENKSSNAGTRAGNAAVEEYRETSASERGAGGSSSKSDLKVVGKKGSKDLKKAAATTKSGSKLDSDAALDAELLSLDALFSKLDSLEDDD